MLLNAIAPLITKTRIVILWTESSIKLRGWGSLIEMSRLLDGRHWKVWLPGVSCHGLEILLVIKTPYLPSLLSVLALRVFMLTVNMVT